MNALSRFPSRFVFVRVRALPLFAGARTKIFTELSVARGRRTHWAHRSGRPSRCRTPARVLHGLCLGARRRRRIPAHASQRKLLKRHSDLEVTACKPWATEEQYALLHRYLKARHPGGGMATMDETDYADMVEQSPVSSYVIEYREPTVDGRRGRLVGACITDQQADGLSMIYSFFLADEDGRPGLGNFIILDHICAAARGACPMLSWLWVRDRSGWRTRRAIAMEVLGPNGGDCWSKVRAVAMTCRPGPRVRMTKGSASLPSCPTGRSTSSSSLPKPTRVPHCRRAGGSRPTATRT